VDKKIIIVVLTLFLFSCTSNNRPALRVKAVKNSQLSSKPNLISKAYDNGILYIGHRGIPKRAPEHSFEGYDYAIDNGIRAIEPDCWLLKDGTFAILHDKRLNRTTTGSGKITNKTSSTLKEFKVDIGDSLGKKWKEKRLEIPILDKFLLRYGNKVLILPEIKSENSAEKLVETLKKYKISKEAVIVQSTRLDDLIPVVKNGYYALALGTSFTPKELIQRKIKYIGVSKRVNKKYIDSMNSAGIRVIVYTINTISERDKFISMGVSGFFTDDGILLRGK